MIKKRVPKFILGKLNPIALVTALIEPKFFLFKVGSSLFYFGPCSTLLATPLAHAVHHKKSFLFT